MSSANLSRWPGLSYITPAATQRAVRNNYQIVNHYSFTTVRAENCIPAAIGRLLATGDRSPRLDGGHLSLLEYRTIIDRAVLVRLLDNNPISREDAPKTIDN